MRALHNSWTRILSCSSVCLYTLLATLSSNLLPPHRQRSLYRKPSFSMIKQIGMHMLMHTCPENHEASTYCSRRRQGCLKFLLETSLHSTGPPVCSAVPAPARLTLWHDHPSPGREVLRRQKANQIRTIQQSKARRQEACRSSGLCLAWAPGLSIASCSPRDCPPPPTSALTDVHKVHLQRDEASRQPLLSPEIRFVFGSEYMPASSFSGTWSKPRLQHKFLPARDLS